jgi:hypothetical protein
MCCLVIGAMAITIFNFQAYLFFGLAFNSCRSQKVVVDSQNFIQATCFFQIKFSLLFQRQIVVHAAPELVPRRCE